LGPVSLGGRSETMRGLLQPGFHTGTVPKLFARLRQAERQAGSTGTWSGVRACRSALAEVEQAVNLFVTREFCELLAQTPAWEGAPPRVGQVTLANNLVRVELQQPGAAAPEQSLWLEFETRAGCMIAGIAVPGWQAGLSGGQRVLLDNALATLYKLAGVDRIAEPLPDSTRVVDHADSASRTFRQIPITWEQCVTCWPMQATALMPPRLLGDGVDPPPVAVDRQIVDGIAKETPCGPIDGQHATAAERG
jgi:hypothetical protein